MGKLKRMIRTLILSAALAVGAGKTASIARAQAVSEAATRASTRTAATLIVREAEKETGRRDKYQEVESALKLEQKYADAIKNWKILQSYNDVIQILTNLKTETQTHPYFKKLCDKVFQCRYLDTEVSGPKEFFEGTTALNTFNTYCTNPKLKISIKSTTEVKGLEPIITKVYSRDYFCVLWVDHNLAKKLGDPLYEGWVMLVKQTWMGGSTRLRDGKNENIWFSVGMLLMHP